MGLVLSRYKSGPLPKPFKIIPSLPAWARILALTKPENWTPQACHAATRIFVSQMKPAQARVFLEGVLLDAIREDIRLTKEGQRRNKNNRKLNVHYYEALKRALYKPAAFFKGIIFPLLSVSLDSCSLLQDISSMRNFSQDAPSRKPLLSLQFSQRLRFLCSTPQPP